MSIEDYFDVEFNAFKVMSASDGMGGETTGSPYRAYTNDPAAGSNIELNMANTSGFIVGDVVTVSSSAGSEIAIITVVHTNTHITVDKLVLNHTKINPKVYNGFTFNGAIDLISGSKNMVAAQYAERATHILLCPIGIALESKHLIDDGISKWRILNIDDPVRRGHHLEVILEYIGVSG